MEIEGKKDGAKSRISLEKFLFKIKNKWKMNKKKKISRKKWNMKKIYIYILLASTQL